MSGREKPHYTLPAAALATWIESQPERWWMVDGDPLLTSPVDFPCPGDELAPAIRRLGKDLLLQDTNPATPAHGERIGAAQVEQLFAVADNHRNKALLLSWADSDTDWLLLDDEALVEK